MGYDRPLSAIWLGNAVLDSENYTTIMWMRPLTENPE